MFFLYFFLASSLAVGASYSYNGSLLVEGIILATNRSCRLLMSMLPLLLYAILSIYTLSLIHI